MLLADIKPHPRNPRVHPEPGSAQWEIVRRSLGECYFEPLVLNVRNGMLISGHLRWKVMLDMGVIDADVSVIDCDEAVHYALMVHANRHQGEFDPQILSLLLTEIEMSGIEAALAGFDHDEMMKLIRPPEIEDDTEQTEELVSKAEQLQAKWKVQLGDLFQIDAHRLMCGDCASVDNWKRILPDGLADMIWCDPPYNIDYDGAQRKRNKIKAERGEATHVKPQTILNDNHTPQRYEQLLCDWFAAGSAMLKPGGAVYIAHADSFSLETRIAAKKAGFKIAQCLIWVKQAFTLGRQDYQWQHEPILVGWKLGAAHYWQGGFTQSTVIDQDVDLKKLSKAQLIDYANHLRNALDTTVIREPRNVCSDLHPTIKPTRLVARHLWNSSRLDEIVLELFNGSGTTMAAAQMMKRRCVAQDLDPKFVAVTLERMSLLGCSIEKINA
jgi:DNA modification methylase